MEQSQQNPQNLVGPAVRSLRTAAGITQKVLSAKIQLAGWDLSREGLSKIEAQLRRVNDAELYLLARVLKCEMRDLFPKRPRNLDSVVRPSRGRS